MGWETIRREKLQSFASHLQYYSDRGKNLNGNNFFKKAESAYKIPSLLTVSETVLGAVESRLFVDYMVV